jgi:hypothetical protein
VEGKGMRHVDVEVLYRAAKDGEKPSVTIIVPDDLLPTEVLGIAEQVLARVTQDNTDAT